MNLLELKKRAVEATGRRDLVVNETAYADNGINNYINAAVRRIESFRDLPHMKATAFASLAAGGYSAFFESAKYIEEVWLVDMAASTRAKLEYVRPESSPSGRTYDLSSMDQSTPLYWTIESTRLAVDNMVADPCFSLAEDDSPWTVGAGWEIQESYHRAYRECTPEDWGELNQNMTDMVIPTLAGGSYLLSYRVNSVSSTGFATMGYVKPYIHKTGGVMPAYGAERSETGYYNEVIEIPSDGLPVGVAFVPDLTGGLSVLFKGWISEVSLRPIVSGVTDVYYTGALWSDLPSVVVWPPADRDLQLEVHGKFYSPSLVNDPDVNFWTMREPELLMKAIEREIEGAEYRNAQGERDYWEMIARECAVINMREIHQNQAVSKGKRESR